MPQVQHCKFTCTIMDGNQRRSCPVNKNRIKLIILNEIEFIEGDIRDTAFLRSVFNEALKRMSDEVREQDPNNRDEPVLMPNDPQINFSKEREKKGIPVMQNILDLISIE